MYCRKCGSKMDNNSKYCSKCGEEVKYVKQRTDAQRFEDKRKEEKENNKKGNKKQSRTDTIKNPYVIPAFGSALLAFLLAIFPWPQSWGIGTSLWMRILILVIALLASYHTTKSKQVNRLFDIKYGYMVKPKLVTAATVLSVTTLVVALYSLFMM